MGQAADHTSPYESGAATPKPPPAVAVPRTGVVTRAARSVLPPHKRSFSDDEFVSVMLQTIQYLRAFQPQSRFVPETILSILREVVRRETHQTKLDLGIGELFFSLWGGDSYLKLLLDLCKIAQASQRFFQPSMNERLLRDTQSLLLWYGRRKTRLRLIPQIDPHTRPVPAEGEEIHVEKSVIHTISVSETRRSDGRQGALLVLCAAIHGYAHDRLWVKIKFRALGGVVRCRDGWDWIDTSEGGNGQLRPELCVMAPIIPETSRAFIDHIELFIPYDAMPLEVAGSKVDLHIELVDIEKRVLAELEHRDVAVGTGTQRDRVLPSPQGVGLWSSHIGTGDYIEVREVRVQAESIELDLAMLLVGQQDREVVLSCRVSEELSVGGSVQPSSQQRYVPDSAVYYLRHRYTVQTPAEHGVRGERWVELVVHDNRGKVLCGTLVGV